MTTEDRIDDLERRLAFYHQALTEAIEERDRLALDAAWGVHLVLYTFVGAALIVALLVRFPLDLGWFGDVLAGFGLFAAIGGIGAWSNDARMREVKRLAKLPGWRRHWGSYDDVDDE